MLVFVAVMALAAGPGLSLLSARTRIVRPILRGFVLVSLGALVLFHVLPEAVVVSGWVALPVAMTGLVGPGIVERLVQGASRWTRLWSERLAAVGLALHAVLDGAALAAASSGSALESSGELAAAIIIHRVPVSLFLWWMVSRRHGYSAAALLLVSLGALTVAGSALGGLILNDSGASALGLVSAALSGLLLHVLFTERPGPEGHGSPQLETLGGGAALVLVASTLAGSPAVVAYLERLGRIGLETAPALVLGFLLAGLVAVFLPQGSVAWAARGGHVAQTLRGVVFGLPLPICSCGVVPVYRSLIRRGLPPASGLAFLVATPELGIESVLLSLPLLGPEFTAARLGAAFVGATVVGLWVGRSVPGSALAQSASDIPRPPPRFSTSSVRRAFDFGFGEVVAHTGPWIVVGLALAALVSPDILTPGLNWLPPGADVPLLALAGMPIYVCATGATPLAAAFVAAGVSPGAALAFLLSGPATNLTTFGVLARMHGIKTAVRFAGCLLAVSTTLGWALNLAWPKGPGVPSPLLFGEEPGLLQYVCAVVLLVSLGAALLRRGPTGLIQSLWTVEEHDHDCGHHGHAHPVAPKGHS